MRRKNEWATPTLSKFFFWNHKSEIKLIEQELFQSPPSNELMIFWELQVIALQIYIMRFNRAKKCFDTSFVGSVLKKSTVIFLSKKCNKNWWQPKEERNRLLFTKWQRAKWLIVRIFTHNFFFYGQQCHFKVVAIFSSSSALKTVKWI